MGLEDLMNKGNDSFKEGRYNAALGYYEEAIKIEPECARIWYKKGQVLSAIKENEAALEAYERSIEIEMKLQPLEGARLLKPLEYPKRKHLTDQTFKPPYSMNSPPFVSGGSSPDEEVLVEVEELSGANAPKRVPARSKASL